MNTKTSAIIILLGLFLIQVTNLVAQSIGINEDGSQPDNRAILDIKSSGRGVILPRLSDSARDALYRDVPFGMIIFNTTDSALQIFMDTAWYTLSLGAVEVAPKPLPTTITDIDGNTYQIVIIGTQTWMAENLKTTTYNDGTSIALVENDVDWGSNTDGAYCWYNNDEATYGANYGALYDWYAVNTGNLCPEGWHVPSDDEWKTLEMYLGMSQEDADNTGWRGTNEGSKLAGRADLWNDGNLENDSEFGSSGFLAQPGGFRIGPSLSIGSVGYWWSTTESGNYGCSRYLGYENVEVNRDYYFKDVGLSVRCIKDAATSAQIPTVTTAEISDVTSNSATSGGNVTSDGGAEVTAYGVCWNTTTEPTLFDSFTNDGSGTGTFTSSLIELSSNTTYYVRAYATNSEGTAYGNEVSFTTSAGESWGRDNTTEIVDVTNPTTGKTWMDRNLGASHAATSSTDALAYGDLYQWGREADGHEKRTSGTTSVLSTSDHPGHNDFIVPPTNTYNWRSADNDNLWQGENGINNPCPSGYRLPTESEWDAEIQSWSSDDAVGAFSSSLKLLMVGMRDSENGVISTVGMSGHYSSSAISGAGASKSLFFDGGSSYMSSGSRAYGLSVRCIKDATTSAQTPTVTTSEISDVTSSTATSGGSVTSDGGAEVTAYGVCWNTTTEPTLSDSFTNDGSGTGTFTSSLTELTSNTTYYVRAYATNGEGTAYGNEISFTTSAGETWGRDNTTEIVDVTNPTTGKTWMDRNLGASQVATSSTDALAYGDLYQWGREADGHEKRTSGVTSVLSTSDHPGHNDFIVPPNTPYDWRSPENDDLWQGIDGINNPCPTGYRLPTSAEWESERQSWSTNDVAGAFASPLKLSLAGIRHYSNGMLYNAGANGNYWSNTVYGINSYSLGFVINGDANMLWDRRASGHSIRCIKETTASGQIPTVTTSETSNIISSSATSGGNVTSDGGAEVTAFGVCWNTTTEPTLSDSFTNDGSGTGTYTSSITGLSASTTYYVRAYAINSEGTAYGNEVSFTTSASATLPAVTTGSVSDVAEATATCGGNVTSDGGAAVTAYGVCWNTTSEPTLSDSFTNDGSGTGTFTSSLIELSSNTTYYVRAYATNSEGTAYGSEVSFTTSAVETWGRDNTTEIVDVTNPTTGKTWMDRNLGATQAATSSTDALAYGDLYQWGREADGHEKRSSGTTSTLSTSDNPGNSSFIIPSSEPYDWRSTQNDNLWQGVNGINNPCPSGYRLPTMSEWDNERQSWSSNDAVGAYNSPIKLPLSSYRSGFDGSLGNEGSDGHYWTGTVSNENSAVLGFNSSSAEFGDGYRAFGFSVRCIKDATTSAQIPTITTTEISDITASTAISGGNITSDGGAEVTAYGVCWNTTTEPTLSDSYTNDGSGTGTFTSSLTELTSNTTYYVRAYATNSEGTAYGNEISFTTSASATLPSVTTSSVSNVTETTATCGGNVPNDGGATVTAYGVCWNTTTEPTLSDSYTNDGSGTGTYTSTITGLSAIITYYVRAYATNSEGTAYGNEVSFTTSASATLPSVTTGSVSDVTETTATCGGNVTDDGGATVTAYGVCWNTSTEPTLSDSFTNDGSGTGSFTSSLTELTANTTYYVRAYATNSEGSAYGDEVCFMIHNGTAVVEIINPSTGTVWMDRNLGANQVADSSLDEGSYGDLYQWGRATDGHEKRTSVTTSTLSNSDNPGHSNFIVNGSINPYDWRSPQNDNLWQGAEGTNNPCPNGYRLPTKTEWMAEIATWSSNNAMGAYSSPLKLPVAGARFHSGELYNVGSKGYYWSSTVDLTSSWYMNFSSSIAGIASELRASGRSVRCIKE